MSTKLNVHKGHLASCLCCTNLEVDFYDTGYSEYTPSGTAVFRCRRNHFDLGVRGQAGVIEVEQLHDLAPQCADFAARA